MSRLFDSSHYVVSELLAEVRWEVRDILSRHNKDRAMEFMLARASELAMSAKGCDQLMGSAISEAVRNIGRGRTPLPEPPAICLNYDDKDIAMRSAIRNEVLKAAASHWEAAATVAAECVNSMIVSHDRTIARDSLTLMLSPGILHLQKCLWDHPSIAANTETRLKMLFLLPAMQLRLGLAFQKNAINAARRRSFGLPARSKQPRT